MEDTNAWKYELGKLQGFFLFQESEILHKEQKIWGISHAKIYDIITDFTY